MQQSVLCPKCNVPNAPGQGFCASCGAHLQLNCPNCDSIVDSSSKFCPVCGTGLGWAMRYKELQSQITQTENGIRGMITQNMSDMQNQLIRTEEDLKNTLGQYVENLQSQQLVINQTAQHIAGLIAEEHALSLSKKINRIGIGVIALGLAVVGMAYVMGNDETFALGGVIIVSVGFLLQLISNFITAKPRYINS